MTPDITMCRDTECPQRMECYRYRAVLDAWQSFFVDSPRTPDGCEDFMPIEKGDELREDK